MNINKQFQAILRIVFLPLIFLLLLGYGVQLGYRIDKVGFGDFLSPKIAEGVVFERAKTIWDWLSLLLIPFLLTVGSLLANYSTQKSIKLRDEERAKLEKDKAEQREKFERWVKYDSAREQALQEYLASMQELILENGLRELSKNSSQMDSVNEIARARTLDILRRLDGERKRLVLDFLYQTGLIDTPNPRVSLIAASFGVNRTPIITSSGEMRQKADYFDDVVRAPNLQQIYLKNADLNGAIFCDVIFVNANLKGVNFTGANLENANLSGADLSNAILSR